MKESALERLFAPTEIDPTPWRRFQASAGWRYGLVFGAVLVLVGWGWDTIELARVATDWYWLKFCLISIVLLLLTTAAGAIAGRAPSFRWRALAWIALCGAAGWAGMYLSFDGVSAVVAILDPAARGVPILPLVPGMQARGELALVFGAIGGLFAAAFQNGATRWAWDNTSSDNKFAWRNWLAMLICLPIAIPLGALYDGATNAQLRGPLQLTYRIIQVALYAPPDLDTHQMPINELLDYASAQPWRDKFSTRFTQRVADLDPQTLNEAYIDAEFDNGFLWRCRTTGSGAILQSCQDLTALYRDWMKQFLESGVVKCEACALTIDPAAAEWQRQFAHTLGEPQQISVIHRSGRIVLVRAEFARSQAECRFVGAAPVIIYDCVMPPAE